MTAYGCGDSHLLIDVMPEDTSASMMEKLLGEVNFIEMTHKGGLVPRLVAIQHVPIACSGRNEGRDLQLEPIYRHPTEDDLASTPMTPTVSIIRERVEAISGQQLNHVLIQYYRNGNDYISEHSDKTLDILRGSSIINFSVGASRTFYLKRKRCEVPSESEHPSDLLATNSDDALVSQGTGTISSDERIQKIVLPHNSAFVCGWRTNERFMHGIKADKRRMEEKRPDELLYNQGRISLTFRSIATYRCRSLGILVGQGATIKDITSVVVAAEVAYQAPLSLEEQRRQSEELVQAFSDENKSPMFDWDTQYGRGFDITHLKL